MHVVRYFSAAERLANQPVWSHEYALHSKWAPTSPLLDECRQPVWWTPQGFESEAPAR